MSHRQSGAAHVNIYFLIVTIILFLGALGFAYTQHTEVQKLTAERDQARTEAKAANRTITHREQLISELSDLIGDVGEYEGKEGFDWTEYGGKPEPLKNVSAPAKITNTVKEFGAALSVPESSRKGLGNLLGAAKSAFEEMKGKVASLDSERTKLLADKAALEKSISDQTRDRSGDVARLTQQHNEFRGTIDNALKGKDDLITSMRVQVSDRDKKLQEEKEARAADVLKLNKDVNVLQARINAQAEKVRLINPPQMPDGDVLSASPSTGLAYISLGRKDMLPLGTVFRVSAPGSNVVKAHATVVRLEQDRAEVQLSGLRDRFDPVVRGDVITNDLYSPNVRRTVVLIGRFTPPLNKPTVKLLMENLGNKVVDAVTPGVDLVVVGGDALNEAGDGFTPITETAEYKQAQFLGIEISPMHKVRDFLKLD